MNFYPIVAYTLAALSVAAWVAGAALLVALALPGARASLQALLGGQERHPIGWAWFVAATAMAGSLYLSDVVGFVPCLFCWYQRIAMYPLVLVLGVGLLRGDAGVWRYGLPLALVGLPLSAYHVALQYRPTLDFITCDSGVPCSGRYMAVFGFVSIPVMAGAAFLLIASLLLLVRTLEAAAEGDDETAPMASVAAADRPGL